jgi:dolichyl-phosphate-mannose-protein mannosyltransferase
LSLSFYERVRDLDTTLPLVPPGEQSLYSSPFFRDFWHLNVAMMTSNNALIPDPDKEDVLASKPTDWPWMRLGLRMCGWADNQIKYYLLGTPIVWWSGTFSLIFSLIALGIYLLRMQRRYNDFEHGVLFCLIQDTPCNV